MVSWNPFAKKEPTSSFDPAKWSGFLDQAQQTFFGPKEDTAAQQFLSDRIRDSGSGSSNQNAVFGDGGWGEGPNGSTLWNPSTIVVRNQEEGETGGPGGMGVEKPSGLQKILGTAGQALGLAGAFKSLAPLTFASIFPCDIRLKEDIAPLEQTDINDDLAEIAFFIKDLRESN